MPLSRLKSTILLAALLLIRTGHAQTRLAAESGGSESSELTVRVTLPAALNAAKDYAAILLSKDQDKLKNLDERRKRRTTSPVLTFSLAMPKSIVRKLAGNN
ncbi:hypothetical protein SAMN02745146_2184 [Hymenobacter daecheongensis DSM 21074]|uniref:Uncharacterized protein n=1 Tax=Hymenobacter daecheongensis DSM 21074 TaxID=1121955 RepID=A0A1M6GAV2_9BACT|nr:hypothetical protein [Hymenobacter daecheongensis]SHJ07075.1 hypothetical protein SAMN02745146_2184 [Hymenobacter daecheongensis DSM 21074]